MDKRTEYVLLKHKKAHEESARTAIDLDAKIRHVHCAIALTDVMIELMHGEGE